MGTWGRRPSRCLVWRIWWPSTQRKGCTCWLSPRTKVGSRPTTQTRSASSSSRCTTLGSKALPLYSWLTKALPNQWGVNRIVFDYERFLVDEKGQPLRRYPRKYPVEMMEVDVRAIIAGKPLPPPTLAFLQAWEDAKREATKSEYAFKPGLNYYSFGSPAS